MSSEKQFILEMLHHGKISVDEAERLLNALGASAPETPFGRHFQFGPGGGPFRKRRHRHRRGHHHGMHHGPRFIHIEIDEYTEDGHHDKRRLKVPLKLLKAGINLSGLLPRDAREGIAAKLKAKGIDVDPFSLRGMDIDEFAEALSDLDLDLDGAHIRIRVDTGEEDEDEVTVEAEVETEEDEEERL